MAIQRSVVAVPARLASSRLPDKVIADIGGKLMIQRVLEQCAKAVGPSAVVLCTDTAVCSSWRGLGFPCADDVRLQFGENGLPPWPTVGSSCLVASGLGCIHACGSTRQHGDQRAG